MEYKLGEYYTAFTNDKSKVFIWKCGKEDTLFYSDRIIHYYNNDNNERKQYHKNESHGWRDSKPSTPLEIHWLNVCIERGKYVEPAIAYATFNQKEEKINDDPNLGLILKKLLNI